MPADVAAAIMPFDATFFLREGRRLGVTVWIMRDTRTGAEELRGVYPFYAPDGMEQGAFEEQMAALSAWAKTDPSWKHQVADALRAEGNVLEYRSTDRAS